MGLAIFMRDVKGVRCSSKCSQPPLHALSSELRANRFHGGAGLCLYRLYRFEAVRWMLLTLLTAPWPCVVVGTGA